MYIYIDLLILLLMSIYMAFIICATIIYECVYTYVTMQIQSTRLIVNTVRLYKKKKTKTKLLYSA